MWCANCADQWDLPPAGGAAQRIYLSPLPRPHEKIVASAPGRGVRVDRNFTGERSGAPAGERFSDLSSSGRSRWDRRHYDRPPQGLSPIIRGEALAGRRQENRRGGRSASAQTFRGVTARHSPGARHPLATRGEDGRKAGQGSRRFHHPVPSARGNADARHVPFAPAKAGAQAGFVLRSSCVLRFRPGCPAGAGHERTDVCCEGAPHTPSSFRRRPESSTRGPTVVMAGLVPAMPVVREWWLPPT